MTLCVAHGDTDMTRWRCKFYTESHEGTSNGYWRDDEYVAEQYDVFWEFVSRNCTEFVDTTDVGEP